MRPSFADCWMIFLIVSLGRLATVLLGLQRFEAYNGSSSRLATVVRVFSRGLLLEVQFLCGLSRTFEAVEDLRQFLSSVDLVVSVSLPWLIV